MLKREWAAETNGKLPHLFIPSKTATYIPEFAMEDIPLGRILMMMINSPCGEFRWSLEGPISQIQSPHLHAGAPGIFSDLLRSVLMIKRKRTGSYCSYSYLVKLQPWFLKSAVEDLPLGRPAALVPEFAVKDLPLGRTLILFIIIITFYHAHFRVTYNFQSIVHWERGLFIFKS